MSRFILPILVMLFFTGCGPTSSITVGTKKAPPKFPYVKMLVVYAEEPCDFTLLDSINYNICLRSCFLDADNFVKRARAEDLLGKGLIKAAGVVHSTEVFNPDSNSYDYFRHIIDSLHVEAMLLVNFRRYTTNTYPQPGTDNQFTTLNADFACYLMDARNISIPVWTAGLGTKGDLYSTSQTLKKAMVTTLVKELKDEGYLLH